MCPSWLSQLMFIEALQDLIAMVKVHVQGHDHHKPKLNAPRLLIGADFLTYFYFHTIINIAVVEVDYGWNIDFDGWGQGENEDILNLKTIRVSMKLIKLQQLVIWKLHSDPFQKLRENDICLLSFVFDYVFCFLSFFLLNVINQQAVMFWM